MLRSLAERIGGIIPSSAAKSKRKDGASAEYASVPTEKDTEPQAAPDPARALSAAEAAFVYLRMSMVTVALVKGAVDAALIGKALELLRQRHAYLNLALISDFFAPGHLRFVPGADAPLDYRIVPSENPGTAWQALSEEEVTTQWDWNPRRLPWRLTLLISHGKESVLVWTHSPCIADAISGSIFIHELLSLHTAMQKSLIPEKFELPPLPSITTMIGGDNTLAEEVVLRAAYPVTKYQISHPIIRLHPSGPAPPTLSQVPSSQIAARRSTFLYASVPSDCMVHLHKLCKAAHISVGSYLSTALIFANFRQLWRHGHASTVKPTKAELVFHVNMRPRLLTPRETQDIAYFISALPAEWSLSPAVTFWEAATMVHTGVRAQLDRAPLYAVMLEWLLSFAERSVLQTLASGRTGEIAIANLGAYPWSTDYEGLKLDALWSAHSTAAFGAVHTLCTSTANRGAFSWVFDENVARREDAEEMLADVVRLVQQPPDQLFGMLDWLASCVREKEGLPPLSLASLTPAQVDRALTTQEDAPQASSSYAALGSEAPTGASVGDPSLLQMEDADEEDQGVVPPPRSNPTPPISISTAVASPAAPSSQTPSLASDVPETPLEPDVPMPRHMLPPPLSPRTAGSGESLEAIELAGERIEEDTRKHKTSQLRTKKAVRCGPASTILRQKICSQRVRGTEQYLSIPQSALEHPAATVFGVSGQLRIYAAGKMMLFSHPKRDWRGLALRKELKIDCQSPFQVKLKELRCLELPIGDTWVYVGPYYFTCIHVGHEHELDAFYETDDCRKDLTTAIATELSMSEEDRQALVTATMAQIERCDVVYARITSLQDSMAVLTEIGIALGKGKRVYIDCTVDGMDSWLVRGLAARSGATRTEYLTIPWAMFKQ